MTMDALKCQIVGAERGEVEEGEEGEEVHG